jgi:hypothetical protein
LGLYLAVVALIGIPWWALVSFGVVEGPFNTFWELCKWMALLVGLPLWAVLRTIDWVATVKVRGPDD